MIQAQTAVFTGKDRSRVFRDCIAEKTFFLVLEIYDGVTKSEGARIMKALSEAYAGVSPLMKMDHFESWLQDALLNAEAPESCSVAAGIITGNIIYIKTIGDGEIHMRRGKKFVRLIHGTKVASGYVKPDDLLVFTTASFRALIEEEEALKKPLDTGTPEKIVEKLEAFYSEKADHATMAVFARMVEVAEDDLKTGENTTVVPLTRPADPLARAHVEMVAVPVRSDEDGSIPVNSVSGKTAQPPNYAQNATLNTEIDDETDSQDFPLPSSLPTTPSATSASAVSDTGFARAGGGRSVLSSSRLSGSGIRPLDESEGSVLPPDSPLGKPNASTVTIAAAKKGLGGKTRKTITFVVVLVILGIFIWSVVFGYQRRQAAENRKKIDAVSQLVEQKTTEAEEISFLNMERALALLNESKVAVSSLKKEIGNGYDSEIGLLEQKITEKENAIVQKEESEPEEFYDLALEDKNAKGDRMFLEGDKIAILDTVAKTVYNFDADRKSLKSSKNAVVGTATEVGLVNGAIYIFVPDQGVFVFDDDTKVRNVIKNDPEWGNITDMAFFGGNIYLLDSGKGDVYKYVSAGVGYGKKSSYFTGTAPDISGATSLKIDASVYVSMPSKVLKFTRGTADEFQTSFPTKQVEINGVYTDENTEFVYVWDKKNATIFVLDKKGGYNRQIKSPALAKASDFLVYNGRILLLSGSKIYALTEKDLKE
ncbi:MAG: hypothetical protein N2691_00220 [Patescibacteria group bacterium]|nr:hypothetical protein [Patescibacteria group bacterium]